jgi:S-DNA-T family DNA segregation ATPase FtsK/SpoIIIE
MSVTSSTDSRVILDRIGAESLMGRGDLLYKAPDKPKSSRLQGANIEQQEVIRIVDFLKSQAPEVEYVNEIIEKHVLPGEEGDGGDLSDFSKNGSLLEQAIRITVQHQKGSSSFLQRRLNIGFNKAAQLVEEMESLGVVGPQNGSKPREVLISDADSFLASLKGAGE